MRFLPLMGIAVLMVQMAPQFGRAQEAATSPSQGSSAPAVEEKPRNEKETKKRLEQLACGPSGVRFSHRIDKGPQAPPEQSPDKGLIYIIRPIGWAGAGGQSRLGMDGKWMGVNRVGNYFYFEADAGPHYFCMEFRGAGGWLDPPGLLSLLIEKGKTYYLLQKPTMGGNEIDLLEGERGKQYLAKFHRSIFEVKPKK